MLKLKPYYVKLPEHNITPNVSNQSYFPTDLRSIYNFPSGYNGSGQTVAFIELGGGFVQTDLDNYFHSLGLNSPLVQFVSVNGAKNSPTNSNSDDVEVMLDLCVTIGVANGINPRLYMAPNTFQGFYNAIAAAINDNVNIISISWGAPEVFWTNSQKASFNNLFQSATNKGITVCVASGDAGAYDGMYSPTADFPGSCPNVLCCGGTKCSTSPTTHTILSETVWNDSYGATGGGFSSYFPRPTYQPLTSTSSSKRGVPDVAGDADPATGIKVITDGQNIVVGGTSAVAPLWAGIIAVANQKLNRRLGFVNPSLYSSLTFNGTNKPFRDITSGNNGYYTAKAGWDACTGLGSPNVQNLISYLTNH
jgi:kumamolisin